MAFSIDVDKRSYHISINFHGLLDHEALKELTTICNRYLACRKRIRVLLKKGVQADFHILAALKRIAGISLKSESPYIASILKDLK